MFRRINDAAWSIIITIASAILVLLLSWWFWMLLKWFLVSMSAGIVLLMLFSCG